jgi:NAD(P)-dependent dehydrogenase (short-subunit alcohol dehydrogenase family)
MSRSYVVTGGGRGVGRAIGERLLGDAEENAVVAIELDPDTLAWTEDHPASPRAISVIGDVSDEAVAERAADLAEEAGTLSGWVNNAAVFRDASVHSAATRDVLDLIALNLYPGVVGCATAIRRFLATGTGGAIVNVSSHQAQRPVRGSVPYATAKAAIEGLTRAGCGLRAARYPDQRCSARFYRHRALRRVARPAGACGSCADRGRDAPLASDRPGGASRRGGGRRRVPALGRG